MLIGLLLGKGITDNVFKLVLQRLEDLDKLRVVNLLLSYVLRTRLLFPFLLQTNISYFSHLDLDLAWLLFSAPRCALIEAFHFLYRFFL